MRKIFLITTTSTCAETHAAIYETPQTLKTSMAQLTEVFTVPTATAAMQRCYLDLSLCVSDD